MHVDHSMVLKFVMFEEMPNSPSPGSFHNLFQHILVVQVDVFTQLFLFKKGQIRRQGCGF